MVAIDKKKVRKTVAFEWIMFLIFGVGGTLLGVLFLTLYPVITGYEEDPGRAYPWVYACGLYLFYGSLYLLYLSIRIIGLIVRSERWAIKTLREK